MRLSNKGQQNITRERRPEPKVTTLPAKTTIVAHIGGSSRIKRIHRMSRKWCHSLRLGLPYCVVPGPILTTLSAKTPILGHTSGIPPDSADEPEMVSFTSARTPPLSRAGGQDDGSYTNSLKLGVSHGLANFLCCWTLIFPHLSQ